MKPPNYTEGLEEAEERLRVAGELSSARTAADVALVLNALNYYRSLAASHEGELRLLRPSGDIKDPTDFYGMTGTRKRYGMEGP